jgi:hypothetical protein
MLFLNGFYVVGAEGKVEWFRWAWAPVAAEFTALPQTIAERAGRSLQRRGMRETDG